MKKRLYLIDGSGFIFRAFYALPKLTRSDGTPTGAVYGFITMIVKLLTEQGDVPSPKATATQGRGPSRRSFSEDGSGGGSDLSAEALAKAEAMGADAPTQIQNHVAVIFDAGRHSFRNDLYAHYKANRDEPPEELRPQFALVREAAKAMGLPGIEQAGFEADDLIASYTREAALAGYEVVIVSSDKDLMQLVNDAQDIALFDAMKDKPIREAEVIEKFGVPPAKVGDVLALMGDTSDNVPGIPGIGPKTAAELIQAYGDLETLLTRASEIKQNKRRESIIEHADKARLSRQLVALKDDMPLPLPLEACEYKGLAEDSLRQFLKKMEFRKLEDRLSKPLPLGEVGERSETGEGANHPHPKSSTSISTSPTGRGVIVINSESELASLVVIIREHGRVALSLERETGDILGIALAVEGMTGYMPVGHITQNTGDLFAQRQLAPGQLPLAVAEKYLKPLLADPAILKLTWRGKQDLHSGWNITPMEDVCLLSYVLEAGLHGHEFSDLVELPEESAVRGTGRSKISSAEVEPSAYAVFAGARAAATLQLWHKLRPQLFTNHLLTVYERIERPLLPVLAAMEGLGIKVDLSKLRGLSAEFNAILRRLEQEIYTLANGEFLIGSPKQLGEVLFERLSLPGGKKSKKSGQYATGAEVLEELAAQGHSIAEKVLEWRQYDKLRSTYTEALEKQINPQTGRVHTTFVQTIAATGRLSSTDPNLQNIPIRSEAGKRIREAFIAADGYDLISADYSQIELRLLAEMADIPVLKQAFREGQDIHAATASQMFGVPIDQMTPDLRRRAKTINFGIIYGISAHGLAVRLGIDRGVAAEFIDAYFKHYPGIKAYMEAKKQEARTHGYITTLFGRRVHIAGINDSNFMRRAFAERQAINAPLQGTAADIIKRAMLAISGQWSVVSDQSPRMLLQVHDELVFEVPEGRGQEFAPQIKKIMEQAAQPNLSLLLAVETGIGKNWGEIH